MKVIVSSIMNSDGKKMWSKLEKVSTLFYISWPLLKFTPSSSSKTPLQWKKGKKYTLNIYGLCIIPLGKHIITVQKKDSGKKELITEESGTLTSIWNHHIKIESVSKKVIKYTDEIDIEAGVMTLFVWFFCSVFLSFSAVEMEKNIRLDFVRNEF